MMSIRGNTPRPRAGRCRQRWTERGRCATQGAPCLPHHRYDAVSVWACRLLAAATLALAAVPAAGQGRFVPGPCVGEVPPGELATCGWVELPERRGEAIRRTHRLPVMVLRSRALPPAPDPVLYLEGGPGLSPFGPADGEDERMEAWWSSTAAFRRTRDVILYEPRGAVRSQPGADCPELDALAAGPPVHPRRRDALEAAAVAACAARLGRDGPDPAGLSTPGAAEDALAVADALGVDAVNLYGLSYGTRVGLEVIRRAGPRVRAAVLDGVFPPDVNAREEQAALAHRAFRRLFDDCAANRRCRAAFPDLEKRVTERLRRLERAPAKLQAGPLGAMMVVDAVLAAMADGEPVTELPELLDAVARGRYEGLRSWLWPSWMGDPDTAEGLALSIECRETVNAADPARVAAGLARWAPFLPTDDPGPRLCAGWPAGDLDPAERLPVASPVPVLLLSGAYDPVTPPEWGERAASTLPRGRHVVFRSAGHGVTLLDACAAAMAARFIERPDPATPALCPSAARPPAFITR